MVDRTKIVFEGQPKPKLIVVLESGMVTSVLSNVEIEAFMLDYDVDCMDETEDKLVRVPQKGPEGVTVEPEYCLAALYREAVDIVPDERLDQIISLKYPNGDQIKTT